MVCPHLRAESTFASLFCSLPIHSSGCTLPICSSLTKTRQLDQGLQGAEEGDDAEDALGEGLQGADEDAEDGTLGQWGKAKKRLTSYN